MIIIPKSERSVPSIASNRASSGRPAPRGESLQRLSDTKTKQEKQLEQQHQQEKQQADRDKDIVVIPMNPTPTSAASPPVTTTAGNTDLSESKPRKSLFSSRKDTTKMKGKGYIHPPHGFILSPPLFFY